MVHLSPDYLSLAIGDLGFAQARDKTKSITAEHISSTATFAVVSTTIFDTSPTSYSVHPPYPSRSFSISLHVAGLCPSPSRRSNLRRHSSSEEGRHSTTTTFAPAWAAIWRRLSRWWLRERGESMTTLRRRRSCVAARCQSASYDTSFKREGGSECAFWRETTASLMSSLSRSGILRAEAMECAKVLFPVPG
ncbi:hypothetical protein PIB30_001615 [Stylosanthes scabra]|uniref:Uncharacterized protein n=1 Tax=Stylosanthes scabra TaxID=79078 RepID=A0ABU6S2Y4_9FABA|nr:hypothetical protein [Stylosanthes scabra]